MSIMIPPIYLGKPGTPWPANDPQAEDRFYEEFGGSPLAHLGLWIGRRRRACRETRTEQPASRVDIGKHHAATSC